ncbi:MAG: phosphopantetheine-binding protein [Bacteroidales bacterium]|jgi:acyl carrier protein|nr:phosphopantetheine-binding protein [Bacteroidales bacterium]
MDELILKLKQEIIEVLNLEEVKPEDIDENAPLFGSVKPIDANQEPEEIDENAPLFSKGLGLDSIDALELIVLMEKNYGIKLKDPAKGKEIFKSVKVLAQYVEANRTK